MIAPLVAGATTALKLYSTATKVSKNQTNLNAAALARLTAMEKANALQLVASNGGLTIRETLMGVYSGQIGVTTALTGLWTKAQTALNAAMASNPIGLLVTAGAALAACIGTAILLTDDEAASTDRLTEAQKENIQAAQDEIDSINEKAAARQKIFRQPHLRSTMQKHCGENCKRLLMRMEKCRQDRRQGQRISQVSCPVR